MQLLSRRTMRARLGVISGLGGSASERCGVGVRNAFPPKRTRLASVRAGEKKKEHAFGGKTELFGDSKGSRTKKMCLLLVLFLGG